MLQEVNKRIRVQEVVTSNLQVLCNSGDLDALISCTQNNLTKLLDSELLLTLNKGCEMAAACAPATGARWGLPVSYIFIC